MTQDENDRRHDRLEEDIRQLRLDHERLETIYTERSRTHGEAFALLQGEVRDAKTRIGAVEKILETAQTSSKAVGKTLTIAISIVASAITAITSWFLFMKSLLEEYIRHLVNRGGS